MRHIVAGIFNCTLNSGCWIESKELSHLQPIPPFKGRDHEKIVRAQKKVSKGPSRHTSKIMWCGHGPSSVVWSHVWPGPQPNAIWINFIHNGLSHTIKYNKSTVVSVRSAMVSCFWVYFTLSYSGLELWCELLGGYFYLFPALDTCGWGGGLKSPIIKEVTYDHEVILTNEHIHGVIRRIQ